MIRNYLLLSELFFVEHAGELCIIVLRRKGERPQNKRYKEKTHTQREENPTQPELGQSACQLADTPHT
jgi:hypothetical protein